ncbi:MAG: sigma-70 family RNA polymerase sigma factor, partial [Anaerolineae bacterium]|nr:sigma-70 family RNA polymerase sigma factor [Anaerolineae bacterium]
PSPHAPDPLDVLLRKEKREQLEQLMRSCLTTQEREAVELRFVRDWTPREIARHWGVTRTRVYQVLRNALTKLREALDTRGGVCYDRSVSS